MIFVSSFQQRGVPRHYLRFTSTCYALILDFHCGMIVTVLLENEEELSAFQSYHVPEHYFRPSLFLGHLAKIQRDIRYICEVRAMASDVVGCIGIFKECLDHHVLSPKTYTTLKLHVNDLNFFSKKTGIKLSIIRSHHSQNVRLRRRNMTETVRSSKAPQVPLPRSCTSILLFAQHPTNCRVHASEKAVSFRVSCIRTCFHGTCKPCNPSRCDHDFLPLLKVFRCHAVKCSGCCISYRSRILLGE